MISGDIIWYSTCGAYADLKVGGLKEACEGKHTGPWNGGGKRGQLNNLERNRHPRNAQLQLQPPIAESTMTPDLAAAATGNDLAAAKQHTTRYMAKDKATRRSNAADPAGTLTAEKREWIESKRLEAIQRAGQPKTSGTVTVPPKGQPGSPQLTSADKKAAIYSKIRAVHANRRPPSDDGGLDLAQLDSTDTGSGAATNETAASGTTTSGDRR
jgi:hypothetical protein